MSVITQDPAGWQAGYNAGMSGGSAVCPPEIADRLAYASGFIAGRAARQRAAVQMNGGSASLPESA